MTTTVSELKLPEYLVAPETYCGAPIEWVTPDEAGFMFMDDPDGSKKSLIGMLDRKSEFSTSTVALACAARPVEQSVDQGYVSPLSQPENIRKPYTGHMTSYQEQLYPPDVQVLLLPSNGCFTPQEITQLVQTTKIISIFGGSHLGPQFMGPATPTYQAELDGGYDDDRDQNEQIMLREALRMEKPLIGVCRGFQGGVASLIAYMENIQTSDDMETLEGLFVQAEPHHRPQTEGTIAHHPLMNVLPADMRDLCPWLEGYQPVSYHSIKTPYGFLQRRNNNGVSYEEELRGRGWVIAALDGTDDIELADRAVEMLIHIDEGGLVDGYLTQYHPEKRTNPGGEEQQQWHDQHQWSAAIVKHAVTQTDEPS